MRCRLLEVCVDSIGGAIAAREGGAARVELCAGLVEGGTTPSAGLIELAVKRCGLPVHVMIRPRGGDFRYSGAEIEVMERDIEAAKSLGANGVVLGLLLEDGRVDRGATEELIRLARPLSVTFHRAFDMARDPFEALEDLAALGIERLLTSGQAQSAVEGLDLLKALVERAGDRIIVMPGGGVDEGSIARIVRETGTSEVHASGRVLVESPMRHRNPRCRMGGHLQPTEFSRLATDRERIRELARLLRSA